MNISSVAKIAKSLPPDIAILMRGPTGIGKSAVSRQIAADLGMEYLDVRASSITEDKVTGMADYVTAKEKNMAVYLLGSWFIRAARGPCVINLDEFNRGNPQVMQAFFQIVLDRELGNDENGQPIKLHPETRVLACINDGAEYDVSDMDPALLRRFWVVDVEPTVEDFLDYCNLPDEKYGTKVDPIIAEFIASEPEHFTVDMATVTPGAVVPTPASWDRVSASLRFMGCAPEKVAGQKDLLDLYTVSRGFVGPEAAASFKQFVETYEKVLTVEDVLQGSVTEEHIKNLEPSSLSALIKKINTSGNDDLWSDSDAQNLAAFMRKLPEEHMVFIWTETLQGARRENMIKLHSQFGTDIIDLVKKAKDLSIK